MEGWKDGWKKERKEVGRKEGRKGTPSMDRNFSKYNLYSAGRRRLQSVITITLWKDFPVARCLCATRGGKSCGKKPLNLSRARPKQSNY